MLKVFNNVGTRTEKKITLTKSSSLGFPTAFYKENQVSNSKYAVLYYDEESMEIGVRFTNNEEDHAYKIRHSKQGYGGSVTINNLLRTLNWPADKYHGSYNWKKRVVDGVGDVFVIQLKEKAAPDSGGFRE